VNASKRLLPVSHQVVHHIVTSGPPIAANIRQDVPFAWAAAKKQSVWTGSNPTRAQVPWPLRLLRLEDGLLPPLVSSLRPPRPQTGGAPVETPVNVVFV
jgi:hypothetical protein